MRIQEGQAKRETPYCKVAFGKTESPQRWCRGLDPESTWWTVFQFPCDAVIKHCD